jgi:hypothetical protein
MTNLKPYDISKDIFVALVKQLQLGRIGKPYGFRFPGCHVLMIPGFLESRHRPLPTDERCKCSHSKKS